MKEYNMLSEYIKYSKFNTAGRRSSCNSFSQEKCIHGLAVFFIGDNMRTCECGCNNKYYAKGLCPKCYRKKYQQENKEKLIKNKKQYYQDNKEHIVKQIKQYCKDNKEYIAEHAKQYAQEHKKEIAKQRKQYEQEHKEQIAKRRKQYYQTPAGKASDKAHSHNRRTLTKELTKETILRVYEDNIAKYGVLTCYLCGKPIVNNNDSLEHSTPLSREGTNDYENLGIAHLRCNLKKGTMTLIEWFNNKRGTL